MWLPVTIFEIHTLGIGPPEAAGEDQAAQTGKERSEKPEQQKI